MPVINMKAKRNFIIEVSKFSSQKINERTTQSQNVRTGITFAAWIILYLIKFIRNIRSNKTHKEYVFLALFL